MAARLESCFLRLPDEAEPMTICSLFARPWLALCCRQLPKELLLGVVGVLALAACSVLLKNLHMLHPAVAQANWQKERLSTPMMMESSARSGAFLQISDVHLDPWYNESLSKRCFCNRFGLESPSDLSSCAANSTRNMFGQHGCDAPYALLQSTLAAAAANAPRGGYDWIVVTGDFVRHGMRRVPIVRRAAAVREIIKKVGDLIRKHFPDSAVHHGFGHDMSLLGNNDFPGNYNFTITDPKHERNPWFASLVPMLLPEEIGRRSVGSDARATFSRGGYFMERLTPDLWLLSINTAVYHKLHSTKDPFGQFRWMRSVMMEMRASRAAAGAAARQPRALIVGHIPPVIDNFKFRSLWEASYARSYLEIVSQNADLIAGQLFAHLHKPLIRLLPGQASALPLFVAGAVSPVFDNNPSFRVWRYSGSRLLDYTDFYGDLVQAGLQGTLRFDAQLSALRTFNLSSLEAEEWHKKVVLKLETSDDVWLRFVKSLYFKDKGHVFQAALTSPFFRTKTICSIEHMYQLAFHQCLTERGI